MNKKTKSIIFTILILIAVIILAYLALNKRTPITDQEVVKCIGSKSVLYIQLGCHACKTQEEMFGDNYQYLSKVDCWYTNQPCVDNNITATPTWIIKGERVVGVQTIDKLKELTGC